MQFYVWNRDTDSPYDTYVSPLNPVNDGEPPTCPKCGEYAGMIPWLPPHYAEITAYSKAFGDIARCPGNSLAVSDRFRCAWLEQGLKGIPEFAPLHVLRVRPTRLKQKVPSYFHIAPQLWGTQVDLNHSLIDYGRPVSCDKCKSGRLETVRGFSIDQSSWTGEDIFRPWGLAGRIIVTDRVRQLRDNYGLTNVNLTRTEELLLDPHKEWTPWVWELPE